MAASRCRSGSGPGAVVHGVVVGLILEGIGRARGDARCEPGSGALGAGARRGAVGGEAERRGVEPAARVLAREAAVDQRELEIGEPDVVEPGEREPLDVCGELVAEPAHGAAGEGRRAGRVFVARRPRQAGAQRVEGVAAPARPRGRPAAGDGAPAFELDAIAMRAQHRKWVAAREGPRAGRRRGARVLEQPEAELRAQPIEHLLPARRSGDLDGGDAHEGS